MRVLFRLGIFLILPLAMQSAFADDTPLPKTGKNKNPSGPAQYIQVRDHKATLNFEDELVEGNTQKPELFYLFQKKNFNYKRLIKLRENFLPEMHKTAEDVQRVRSSR